MPTYEYRCRDCGTEFERREGMDEHSERRPSCPECGSAQVEQELSAFVAKTSRKS